jgi:hypothetical protein
MDFHIPAELLIICSGSLVGAASIIAVAMILTKRTRKKDE